MKLIINGNEIDLFEGTEIKQTKQVNDISNIKTRETNFTRTFNVPKTADNVKSLEYLSLLGNQSPIPYQKNEADLYNNTGERLIHKGWAVVKKTTDVYKIHIYDGIIDFYKAIEKKTLTDLGLSELNHIKNTASVIATWTDASKPYRYNLADYNGKTIFNDDVINIDYMIPSVNKKWLWDKIFETYGFTYSGSIFDTEDFINNWMTYPKAIGDGTQVEIPLQSFNWLNSISFYPSTGGIWNFPILTSCLDCAVISDAYLQGNTYSGESPPGTPANLNNSILTAVQSGLYKITINGYFDRPFLFGSPYNGQTGINIKLNNSEGQQTLPVIEGLEFEDDFTTTHYLSLNAGDTFSIEAIAPSFLFVPVGLTGDVDVDISFVEGDAVDFEEAFIEFPIVDFINEILWEFSLTPFKDKYTNNIEFLTHEEWLQSLTVIDWSSDKNKYVKTLGESYTISNYAQKNYLRHKYNEDNQDYNDGSLEISNQNLRESIDILKSKIYTIENTKFQSDIVEFNTYRFWDKKLKDDASVEYKDLDKRFYFQRSNRVDEFLNIGSERLIEETTVNMYYREGYDRLSYKQIVQNRYQPLYSILNTARIIDVEIVLNDADILNLDFTKPIFIKEEGSYFIINKIPNYSKEGIYKVELIEIDYLLTNTNNFIDQVLPLSILIHSYYIETNTLKTDYTFVNYDSGGATITATQLDASPLDGGTPTGLVYSESVDTLSNEHEFNLPIPLNTAFGWYEVKITDVTGLVSNIEYVYVPDDASGNTTPFISFIGAELGEVDALSFTRTLVYAFGYFTPTSATMVLQKKDFNTGINIEAPIIITLTELQQNQSHLIDVLFPFGAGYYNIQIITDTISYETNEWIS